MGDLRECDKQDDRKWQAVLVRENEEPLDHYLTFIIITEKPIQSVRYYNCYRCGTVNLKSNKQQLQGRNEVVSVRYKIHKHMYMNMHIYIYTYMYIYIYTHTHTHTHIHIHKCVDQ